MNEEQVRAVVREEIAKAFRSLSESAESSERGYWYESGHDADVDALRMIQREAKSVAESLTPEPQDPFAAHAGGLRSGPPNPFDAPAYGAEEWAAKIRAVIEEAREDGMAVYVTADCFAYVLCGIKGSEISSHVSVLGNQDA